jgi:hypothetical protein
VIPSSFGGTHVCASFRYSLRLHSTFHILCLARPSNRRLPKAARLPSLKNSPAASDTDSLHVHTHVTFDIDQIRRPQPCEDRGMDNRIDQLTALLVDVVLYAGTGQGTTELVCTLCGNGVPFGVAIRVLTKPGCRRNSALRLPKTAATQLVNFSSSEGFVTEQIATRPSGHYQASDLVSIVAGAPVQAFGRE